jgi:Flp pilus assembly protein TadB
MALIGDQRLALLVGRAYSVRVPSEVQQRQNKELEAWCEPCKPRKRSVPAVEAEETTDGRSTEIMDVKRLAGLLLALVVAVPVIASAPPSALASMDVALIALLYVIRSRRWNARNNSNLQRELRVRKSAP